MWISTDPGSKDDQPFDSPDDRCWFLIDTGLALNLSDLMRKAAEMIDSTSGMLDSVATDRVVAQLEHDACGLARIALGQEMKEAAKRAAGTFRGRVAEAERSADELGPGE